jgi:hypothetical protein
MGGAGEVAVADRQAWRANRGMNCRRPDAASTPRIGADRGAGRHLAVTRLAVSRLAVARHRCVSRDEAAAAQFQRQV